MGKRTAVAKAPAPPQSALAANLAIVDKGNYQTFNTKKILGFIGEGWDCLYYSLGNSSLDLMRHSPSLIGFYCMLYLKVKFLMYSKSSKNILFEFGFAPLLFANSVQQSKQKCFIKLTSRPSVNTRPGLLNEIYSALVGGIDVRTMNVRSDAQDG